jgi:monofunctional biosynthetic peptidoglycan transglycosylase
MLRFRAKVHFSFFLPVSLHFWKMKRLRSWLWRLFLAFTGFTVLTTLAYRWLPVPGTPLMLIRHFQPEKSQGRFAYAWVPLQKISPQLVQAVIASEDNRFEQHYGFDFKAMQRAFVRNQKGTRKLLGGSTISMQTAKNVYLYTGRNYLRKALEAWFTVWIELLWGKERIMEVYLNVIEMGPGIYGAEAAAQHYFKKPAAKLNKREAALIAAILPSPIKRNPAKPSSYVRQRADKIQRLMRKLPPQQITATSAQPKG